MANTLKFGNGEWYGKKDTILAYNDENNNYKPLPFDFSRGSTPTGSKATTINKDGLIETVGNNVPRIDYKDNTKGALLLEPSRTNLITQSESFSNSYWAKARLTATSNSVISPDGTLNASKIFGDGSNSWKYINRNGFSLINQNYYTFSVFAKADTLNYVQLILSGATAENYQNFDLLNGVIGSGSNVFDAKIETFVNGWYKCSMTVLATSTATTDLFIDLADSSTMSRAGSFLTSGGIYIYGAQLEQGSYPTSYIPTSGSAVTRLADSCSQTVPDGVIGQTEGTMYAEYYFDATIDNSGGSDRDIVSISANSSNIIKIVHYGNGSGSAYKSVYLYSYVGSSNVVTIISGQYSSGLMKVAAAYKNNDYVLYVNGIQIGTDTSAGVPTCSQFKLGKYGSEIKTPTPINETKLYNTRLSNSELQALTTI